MPYVSVLMPMYNAERYVGAAIESILAQTFSDFEFIIVDDGSTDRSLAIAQSYAARDDRIRLITRPNTGIVGALNDAMRMARGQYIARMDADDQCDPRRFELQLTRMEAEPRLVALGSCAIALDPSGSVLGPLPVPLTHNEIDARHLAGASSMYHPAVMMRADAVRLVGSYREGTCPCEDLDLWLRLAEIGELANLPQTLFLWRRGTSGLWWHNGHQMSETIRRVLIDARRRRGLSGPPPAIPKVSERQPVNALRQWAWLALRSGNLATSRRLALAALCRRPFDRESWRLVYCVSRGR